MNKIFKQIFILIIICISTIPINLAFTENNQDSYLKQNKSIIEELINNIVSAPNTGNTNLDYLYQMIQHHKCDIDIAKSLLNNDGKNEEVNQIAKNIIKNQTINIARMEKLMKILIENLTEDKEKEKMYLKENEIVLKEMNSKFEKLKSTGDINKDFLQTIIIHQQATLEIVNIIIKYTDNVDIKNIVKEEFKSKQLEIENMKKLFESINTK